MNVPSGSWSLKTSRDGTGWVTFAVIVSAVRMPLSGTVTGENRNTVLLLGIDTALVERTLKFVGSVSVNWTWTPGSGTGTPDVTSLIVPLMLKLGMDTAVIEVPHFGVARFGLFEYSWTVQIVLPSGSGQV